MRKFSNKILTSKEYKEKYYNTPDWNVHSYNVLVKSEEQEAKSYLKQKSQEEIDFEKWQNGE